MNERKEEINFVVNMIHETLKSYGLGLTVLEISGKHYPVIVDGNMIYRILSK